MIARVSIALLCLTLCACAAPAANASSRYLHKADATAAASRYFQGKASSRVKGCTRQSATGFLCTVVTPNSALYSVTGDWEWTVYASTLSGRLRAWTALDY